MALLGGGAVTGFVFRDVLVAAPVAGTTTVEGKAAADARMDQPQIPTPATYRHPYETYSLLWKIQFIVRRVAYLLRKIIPFMCFSAYTAYYPDDTVLFDRWCGYLLETVNACGCAFQKFGQWMSMRPDLFPPKIIAALSNLRQECAEHSFVHTKREIEASFGMKLDDIFEHIDERAVASGSVAQVHKARVRNEFALSDGTVDVAVKVQHPTVLDETYVDMLLMRWAVPVMNGLMWAMGSSTKIAVPFAQEAFHHSIRTQLDFKWEAYNLIVFAQNFVEEMTAEGSILHFPRVSTDLLSETVLIESWAEGQTVAEVYKSLSEVESNENRKIQVIS